MHYIYALYIDIVYNRCYNKRKQKNPMRRLKLMTAKKEPFRINMSMSKGIVDFYQEMADEMGIPRANAMIMALKTYMDQQQMLKMSQQVEMLTAQAKMQEMKKL